MTQPGKELTEGALAGELLPAAAAPLDGELLPGDDPLGVHERSWGCMVCGAVRLYDDIHVAARPVRGMEEMFQPDSERGFARSNVRYCRDRATCTVTATGATAWPAPAPVLEAGFEARLTDAGCRDRIWMARDERVGTDLARMVLQHLAANSATTLRALAAEHCAAAPDLMFGTVRRLVEIGAVEVTDSPFAVGSAS
jgi:hypothetical protein